MMLCILCVCVYMIHEHEHFQQLTMMTTNMYQPVGLWCTCVCTAFTANSVQTTRTHFCRRCFALSLSFSSCFRSQTRHGNGLFSLKASILNDEHTRDKNYFTTITWINWVGDVCLRWYMHDVDIFFCTYCVCMCAYEFYVDNEF